MEESKQSEVMQTPTGGPVEPVSEEQQEEATDAVGLEKITHDIEVFKAAANSHSASAAQVRAVMEDLVPTRLHAAGVDTSSAEAEAIEQARQLAIKMIKKNRESEDGSARRIPRCANRSSGCSPSPSKTFSRAQGKSWRGRVRSY